MIRHIKHIPIRLQQKTLTKPPLLPLLTKPYTPTYNQYHRRCLPLYRHSTQHSRLDGVTVKVLDFVCGGRESGHEFGVGVAAEEGVSVPEDGGGGTVETGEDGTLGVEMFVEYVGEVFGAYEGGVRMGRLYYCRGDYGWELDL